MSARLEDLLPRPDTKPAVVTLEAPDGAKRYRVLTRVSDDKLRSIPQQVHDCAAYVAALGAPAFLDGIYNVGEHSGFSMTASPVYQQLLDDARQGRFHALVVRDSSRLGRDYWEKMGTLRDLRAAKIEFHVVEDGGAFDFEDRLHKVKSWASTWADEEKKREEIRKATRATAALRDMGLPTTRPPYGYRSVKDPRLGRRVWRVHEAEGANVRSLFDALLREPDANLSALGRDRGLTPSQVDRILSNRAYTGGYTWEGAFRACSAEVVPPLVTAEAFGAVQEIRGQRRGASKGDDRRSPK